MFLLLARLWQMLRAKLLFCGGAHFLAGAPSLPPPLSPEQEKALLARMAAGDAAARDEPLNVDGDGNELLLSDILGSDEDLVSQHLEQTDQRAVLRRAVEQLSPRERQIMELRFGLADGIERTQKEAADVLGISQSYISRLEKRIIRTLKTQLEES